MESPTENIVCFEQPSVSVSQISDAGDVYDVFSTVSQAGAFIPNQRLVDLLQYTIVDDLAVHHLKDRILLEIDFSEAFFGTQRDTVDTNLQNLLMLIKDADCKISSLLEVTQCSFSKESDFNVLAKSCSHGRCISVTGEPSIVLIGSEAKGFDASIRCCYPRCFTVTGNATLHLKRMGLKVEDCVVPSVIMAGDVIQFVAVYLVRPHFPILVSLSDCLLLNNHEQLLEIAVWCLRLRSFAEDTMEKLRTDTIPNVYLSVAHAELDIGRYFFKPLKYNGQILSQRRYKSEISYDGSQSIPSSMEIGVTRIFYIFRVYELLRQTFVARNSRGDEFPILFPEGLITIPSSTTKCSKALRTKIIERCEKFFPALVHTDMGSAVDFQPLILFQHLNSCLWRQDKPTTKTLRDLYIAELACAVEMLNQAGVAHMDLHPANILWRSATSTTLSDECTVADVVENTLHIKIIDFEDAVIFGDTINIEWVATIADKHIYRYPFAACSLIHNHVAEKWNNDFFLEAIKLWIYSQTRSFSEVMTKERYTQVMDLVAPSNWREWNDEAYDTEF